jgi:phosphonate C-P lyase system protein PhnG
MDALNLMDKKAIKKISGELMDRDIEIISPSETGFIMMTVKDSFGTDFHLGEVLVTKSKVKLDGQEGYAMIMGYDHEKVMMIAVINAALKTEEYGKRVRRRILIEQRKLEKTLDRERALIASTRVNFEVMP